MTPPDRPRPINSEHLRKSSFALGIITAAQIHRADRFVCMWKEGQHRFSSGPTAVTVEAKFSDFVDDENGNYELTVSKQTDGKRTKDRYFLTSEGHIKKDDRNTSYIALAEELDQQFGKQEDLTVPAKIARQRKEEERERIREIDEDWAFRNEIDATVVADEDVVALFQQIREGTGKNDMPEDAALANLNHDSLMQLWTVTTDGLLTNVNYESNWQLGHNLDYTLKTTTDLDGKPLSLTLTEDIGSFATGRRINAWFFAKDKKPRYIHEEMAPVVLGYDAISIASDANRASGQRLEEIENPGELDPMFTASMLDTQKLIINLTKSKNYMLPLSAETSTGSVHQDGDEIDIFTFGPAAIGGRPAVNIDLSEFE